MTCPFTPTNRINIGRLAIHKLKSLMAIEKQLKHSSQDVCYGGNTDNLWLLKINNFHFHSRFKFVRLHFLGQHKQKRCKGTTSRPFSHDVIAATLVDHNDEMSVMLVHQNNPLRIELYLYAYNSLCFMESIWPLVTRLKTFEAKQSHSQSFSGFPNNLPHWEGL